MGESLKNIGKWGTTTFGKVQPSRGVERMEEEVDELRDAVREGQGEHRIAQEMADVVIVLCHIADSMGVDLQRFIDAKMVTNRERKWNVHEDGTGYHVKEKNE